MIILDLQIVIDERWTVDKILSIVSEGQGGLIFRVTVERARHYEDLTFSYLQAAFIGERCLDYSDRIGYEFNYEVRHDPVADFIIKPTDPELLSDMIYELSEILTEEDEREYMNYREELDDFKEGLADGIHGFQEIIDDYYANLVNGEYISYANGRANEDDNDDEGNDFLDTEIEKYPERKFGFWRSAYSNIIGESFYTSTASWIIPIESDVDKILEGYSGIGKMKFESADFFVINNISYLVSGGLLVHFPLDVLLKAMACSHTALVKTHVLSGSVWMSSLFTHSSAIQSRSDSDIMKYTQRIDPKSVPQSESNKYTRGFPSNLLFSMSEFGDQVMVLDDGFIYILWNVEKPGHKELLSLNVKLSDISNTAARISGIVTDIKCPWKQLNDELFEELCYDILYYNPTYDNSRIRKMGKSRSRDGGRDIEVYTQARPGYGSEKYIFQCKYLKTGVSLGASKVTDVSDTVIQYGAAGYGIMTNVVIDATLYDKMDGISENTNVKFVDYSIYQMERVLSRYPQIKARYFKN